MAGEKKQHTQYQSAFRPEAPGGNVVLRLNDGSVFVDAGADGSGNLKVGGTALDTIDGNVAAQGATLTAIKNAVEAMQLLLSHYFRQDTFTATGNGATLDLTTGACKNFSIAVEEVGGTATSWTVVLEVSLTGDAGTFTAIASHTKAATLNGKQTGNGFTPYPTRFVRARCSALDLGTATSIKSSIVGMA